MWGHGMRARRSPLGFVLCLGSVLAAGAVGRAQPCGPAVQLEGPSRLIEPLARTLASHGIATTPSPGCPLLSVRLEVHGALLALTMSEELRRSERAVTDLETAVTMIESFVRSDLSAPLLSGLVPAPSGPPVPITPPRPAVAPPPPTAPPPAPGRFTLGLLAEAAVDGGGSPWLGTSLHACARSGPLCLGSLVRFAAALPLQYSDQLVDQRFALDVYATAELPIRLSRLRLSPGIGLGAGFLRHRVHGRSGSPPPRGSSQERDSDADDYFDEASVSDGGLRIEAQLTLAFELRARLALELRAAYAAAFLDSPTPVLAVGKEMAEPLLPTPFSTARCGVGLRFFGP